MTLAKAAVFEAVHGEISLPICSLGIETVSAKRFRPTSSEFAFRASFLNLRLTVLLGTGLVVVPILRLRYTFNRRRGYV